MDDLLTSFKQADGSQEFMAPQVTTNSSGDYKCKAINADGSTDSIIKTLTVKGELK